jgi:hypothetical protein
MTFLNWSILFAGAAVALPIVIHLLHRRAAKIVDWGATQFLLGSLVSRKRRILLDEILLLACRCLLIALLVTALARPLIPTGSSIAWAVVLPVLLVAAVAFGVGTAVWRHRRARWACYAAGVVLAALALSAVALENVLHLGTLVGQSRDMVLLIDGSASMSIEVEGKSQFARALDEARALVDALHGTATLSIVLAGPVPEVKTPVPLTDTAQLHAVLDGLKPSGGMMAIHDALRTASLILSTADNAGKQIVLITDGQKAGWSAGDRELWDLTAQETRTVQGTMPQVYCRVLDPPGKLRNVAVTELTASRKIVGTDRPLGLRARIANCGQSAIAPTVAYLSVDGKQVDRRPVGQLEPEASETVTFAWRFDAPGPHVVEVRADVQDDLPADNGRAGVVHVLDHLPVLVVNGRPDGRPLERASALVQLALDPGPANRGAQPAKSKPDAFVQVSVLEAGQLGAVQKWSPYRVVILADVRELPDRAAQTLADFVVRGGGLMILPGAQASPEFYNHWVAAAGDDRRRVLPASMRARTAVSAYIGAVHPVAGSLAYDELRPLRDGRQNDLDGSRLSGYWLLDVEAGHAAMVGGRLSDGSPWLVEHALGQGRVLLAASAFDLRDGNLPNRQAFLPLVHGLVYHLAEDAPWDLNLRPGRHVVLRVNPPAAAQSLPPETAPAASGPPPAPRVEVTGADGAAVDASARWQKGTLVIEIDHLSMPGIYRLRLPDSPGALPGAAAETGIPIAVSADPAEAELQWLSPDDWAKIGQSLDMHPLARGEDLQAIAAGRALGVELWKSLMFLAFLCVVGEAVLTWWISLQRIPETDRNIDFTSRAASAGFLEELEKLHERENDEAEPVIDLLDAGE